MKKIWQLIGKSGLIALIVSCQPAEIPSFKPEASPVVKPTLQYQVYELPYTTVHTLRIPAQGEFTVKVAVWESVNTLDTFAHKYGAIAVLNGGFFDPSNGKTTSYIIEDGQIVADPQENPSLMNNPTLVPYLEKIFNRSEFRRYLCGTTLKYAIASRNQPIPENCQLIDALGGGPSLLPEITAKAEGFFTQEGEKLSAILWG